MHKYLRAHNSLWLMTAVLLLLAASRFLRLYGLEMHTDEVWTIWQSLGTPAEIFARTPYDWVPAFYLLLGGWQAFVGIEPLALRLLSVGLFLIGAAGLYRVTRRLYDTRTALVVVLVYGALGYSMRISTEVRAYELMISSLIFALWFTVRYFHRPTLRRALPLGVSLALIFYTYLPGVIGFLMLGVYTLIVYRRAVWRWWLPGLIALVLAAPMIAYKLPQMVERVTSPREEPTLIEALTAYFQQYTVYRYEGYPIALWIGLAGLATLLLLWRWRRWSLPTVALFAWNFGLPLLLYALNPVFKFFDQHYAMALMVGIALWVGVGLAQVRRVPGLAISGLLVLLLLLPYHVEYYPGYWRPLLDNFSWLRERLQAGDVLVMDPNCCEAHEYEWDYATQLYFPEGLKFVTDPTGYRRVWYITDETNRTPAVDAAVREGRMEREFVGPAYFFFRLYEGPPDPEGILFENGMRFHGMDLLDSTGNRYLTGPLTVHREGEPLRLRLWWSVDETPAADYSIATYLTARGDILDQFDGPPQIVNLTYPPDLPPQETSQWQPGRYYVEERTLHIPYVPGAVNPRYDLSMVVYQWWDGQRIAAPGLSEDLRLPLAPIQINSW